MNCGIVGWVERS